LVYYNEEKKQLAGQLADAIFGDLGGVDMRGKSIIFAVVLWMSLLGLSLASPPAADAPKAPRALEMADILAWKRIQSPVVSNDGQWFAYRLSPQEGNGEVVVRRIKDGKELRFPSGEVPAPSGDLSGPPAAPPSGIAFSEDSQWLAFTFYPESKEAKKLKKEKKPLYNKVALLNLATEKRVDFEKIRRFAFSGERAGWVALHKYASEVQEKEKEKDTWSGSDVILYELSTGQQLNIGNVSEFSFDKNGQWLAWIVDAQEKTANGVQLRNMSTAAVMSLDSDKAVYKSLSWTEKGDGLAVLKGIEDKKFEDKLYSVIAFSQFSSTGPQKVIYDPASDKEFPAGMTVSPNQKPLWTEDLSAVLFGIYEVKAKKEEKEDDKAKGEDAKGAPAQEAAKKTDEGDKEKPDLVIWNWKDKRLQAQQQVEESRDKNFSYQSIYRVKEKKFFRLADDSLRQITVDPRHAWAVGFDNREYELMGNMDGRRYQDVYVIDLKKGTRQLALRKNQWNFGLSPDGTHLLYYDDGHFWSYELPTGQKYNITKEVPTVFYDQEDDHNIVKPPTRTIGWAKDGKSALITDNWDVWNIPVHGGQATNLTVNGKRELIRYRNRFRLDPEEKGIDLSVPIYFGAYGEWTKKGGIARFTPGEPGVKMLLWEDATFSALVKAKATDAFFYTRETNQDYPDFYVSDATLSHGQRITNGNPQQRDFLWSSGAKLLNYTSAKGDKLQAALFLPANYEAGKSYPTVVYIYEKVSQGLNGYAQPSANGFNKSVYTSNGYAVLMPDIVYKLNDPGMSALWCVLPALKAAIGTGVVDKNRVALHGHSWGGYQTAFLITQTDAFKAAIAGAPLTDMISMSGSIYWNSGSANQPIFESSQGRFAGGYWDNTEAYIRNSPVYHAKNVKTPLLILHNDKDGAVDWTQGIEYFNTLRRMQKPVVMLQYKGENHVLRQPPNQKDYTVRMREFLDHYLLDKPAPKWWTEGIPYLKLKEELEKGSEEQTKK
jgi:dipeptidyl aminopeptidase/acylaminoacyl peptidase